MDFSKIKNSKALKIALIIGLPTALVLGYYGYKWLKNKSSQKYLSDRLGNKEPEIDESLMKFYTIRLPYVTDISTTVSNYLNIQEIPYKSISLITGMNEDAKPIIDYNIGIDPKDLDKLKSALLELGNLPLIETTKDKIIQKPIENPVCVVKRDEINTFKEYAESVGCLDYNVLSGYDIVGIKDIPNIENKITLEELQYIFNFGYNPIAHNTPDKEQKLIEILKKAYA